MIKDLVIPLPELARDANPRPDTSLERLAFLASALDKTSGRGNLTAGNSSPITDGAAGVWVLSAEGRKRIGDSIPSDELIDHEIAAAVDHAHDGLLMAPSFAIPRLLDRNKLTFENIVLCEIHETFAAQVLANVTALEKPGWIADCKIKRDFGRFPWQRVNPNGGSIAIGHLLGVTGARKLSQAVKELAAMPKGASAIVSICADGGEGAVALLEKQLKRRSLKVKTFARVALDLRSWRVPVEMLSAVLTPRDARSPSQSGY
jgi:acetyl-CoA C-acetyltransferase